jgi:hypothetical protein
MTAVLDKMLPAGRTIAKTPARFRERTSPTDAEKADLVAYLKSL